MARVMHKEKVWVEPGVDTDQPRSEKTGYGTGQGTTKGNCTKHGKEWQPSSVWQAIAMRTGFYKEQVRCGNCGPNGEGWGRDFE